MKSLLRLLALFFILFNYSVVFSQAPSSAIEIKQLGKEGILLDKSWKFQAGDNPKWAKPYYDDKAWQAINPTEDIHYLAELRKTEIGWFRLHLQVDSSLLNKPLALTITQIGASEIYLDGKLIHKLGVVSKDEGKEVLYNPNNKPYSILLSGGTEHLVAIRYSFTKSNPYVYFAGLWGNPCLVVQVRDMDKAVDRLVGSLSYSSFRLVGKAGFLLFLSLLHLFFYLSYPLQRTNLYFSLFNFSLFLGFFFEYLFHSNIPRQGQSYFILEIISLTGFITFHLWGLLTIYTYAQLKRGVLFWLVVIAAFLFTLSLKFLYDKSYYFFPVWTLLSPLEIVRVSVIAIKRKIPGAWLIFSGWFSYTFLFVLFVLFLYNVLPRFPQDIAITLDLAIFSGSLTFSILLAREYAQTNRFLNAKLVEVKQLSAKTISQEQEKRQILSTQNETLEKQVKQRTVELSHQKEELQTTLDNLKITQTQLIQKEKMASLGELTAGIAHEIQNPLNFVNNFSEVSEELVNELQHELAIGDIQEAKSVSENVKQNLLKIQYHGQRADAIVKGMLQHAHTSTGDKQLIDINGLVEEYLRLSYHGLRAKDKDFNASLVTNLGINLGKVAVIPQEIGRVLLNLFNNAFYATQQKKGQLNGQYQPEIKVSTSCHDGKVEIRIRDNGCGIPDVVKNKIFQPFFTTKPTGQGTGLGLSLSYDIITKGHQGEIKVDSIEGEYSDFAIILPLNAKNT